MAFKTASVWGVLLYLLVSTYFSSDLQVSLLLSLILWLVWFMAFSSKTKDPYGLFHLSLNYLPTDDKSAPPKHEWLNMGLWSDTQIFPLACEGFYDLDYCGEVVWFMNAITALALKLINSTGTAIHDGAVILDVGHGTGESLILLLSHPSIPRLAALHGVTSLEAHYERAKTRVDKFQSTMGSHTQVHLSPGDAIFRPETQAHPLNPKSEVQFNAVLALDCAYHFNTRKLFLKQAYTKLGPGGCTALADICFSSSDASQKWPVWMLTSVLKLMPRFNVVSVEGYAEQMKAIGYVDVVIEDITENVFPGFAGFMKGRGWGWWGFGLVIEWYMKSGARFVIATGRKGQ